MRRPRSAGHHHQQRHLAAASDTSTAHSRGPASAARCQFEARGDAVPIMAWPVFRSPGSKLLQFRSHGRSRRPNLTLAARRRMRRRHRGTPAGPDRCTLRLPETAQRPQPRNATSFAERLSSTTSSHARQGGHPRRQADDQPARRRWPIHSGVAACEEIVADPVNAFRYTLARQPGGGGRHGTAVLGLGDIGPLAAKPVMEGKGACCSVICLVAWMATLPAWELIGTRAARRRSSLRFSSKVGMGRSPGGHGASVRPGRRCLGGRRRMRRRAASVR